MKNSIILETKTELMIPLCPNFIRSGKHIYDIADLDNYVLVKIADAWKQNLLESAENRRKIN
jgi:hypothetical protein